MENDYITERKYVDIEVTPCIKKKNNFSQTPLFSAISLDNVKCVEALVQSPDIELNAVDNEGNTCIHLCARFNNVESLRYLLKMSKFLDVIFVANNSRELPLHVAAKNGNLEVFKLILGKFYDGLSIFLSIFLFILNNILSSIIDL